MYGGFVYRFAFIVSRLSFVYRFAFIVLGLSTGFIDRVYRLGLLFALVI
jgi:hypothetical protein